MNSIGIRKDDMVVILSGNYKTTGKSKGHRVLKTYPKTGKVLVEGVNVAKYHKKPRRQGDNGGIIEKEIPINACKVMRVCPKCDRPTRTAYMFLEDGSKTRVCKKCREII